MKIYVAAPYGWIPRVQVMYAALKAMGHTITHDWTRAEVNIGAEPDITDERKGEHAIADIQGVRDADLVILLAAKDIGTGCFIEVGAAMALGIPVLVVGRGRDTIFWYHPKVRVVEGITQALLVVEEC